MDQRTIIYSFSLLCSAAESMATALERSLFGRVLIRGVTNLVAFRTPMPSSDRIDLEHASPGQIAWGLRWIEANHPKVIAANMMFGHSVGPTDLMFHAAQRTGHCVNFTRTPEHVIRAYRRLGVFAFFLVHEDNIGCCTRNELDVLTLSEQVFVLWLSKSQQGSIKSTR